MVKRVVAVSGDPIPAQMPCWAGPRVPAGKLALLGDNHPESSDSRHHGFVDMDRVVGVAVRRLG